MLLYMYVNMGTGEGSSVRDARRVTGQAKCPTEAKRESLGLGIQRHKGCNKISV